MGKSRSHDRTNGQETFQRVNAWVSAQHLLLGHRAVPEESNEMARMWLMADSL